MRQRRQLYALGQPRARHGPRAGSGPRADFVRPARCSKIITETGPRHASTTPTPCIRPKLLIKHRQKTFVLNNVFFYCFDKALLNPQRIVNTDYQYYRCRRDVTPTCIALTTTSGTRAIVHHIFDHTRDSTGAIWRI